MRAANATGRLLFIVSFFETRPWLILWAVLLGLSACAAPSGSVTVEQPKQPVGPQVQAPVYRDGDWWKVEVEYQHKEGFSRSADCKEMYSEFIVKTEKGKQEVYGLRARNREKINCPVIIRDLLNIPSEEMGYLKFPLTVGQRWSSRFLGAESRRWRSADYRVVSWEKIRLPKGEFWAFRIERSVGGYPPSRIYYYSPEVKAIILFERKSRMVDRTVRLVDFKVSQ